MALPTATRLGPYEITTPLGAGGMGEVYRARDSRLGRDVALKVLSGEMADDSERRARFEREARAVAALDHPHICGIYDVGEANGTHYLVMPLLEGQTLAARLEKGALPIAEALTIAGQIADALDGAHRQGIVHRDLKPANVMLTKSGAGSAGSPQVELLDFGLAKLRPTAGAVALSDARSATTAAGTAEARNDWRGHVTATKEERVRHAPLTARLLGALQAHRHLRGDRVLTQPNGSSLAEHMLTDLLRRVARRANLRYCGVHVLRHTFCSHLAMRGAPMRAVQELAGHRDLSTTQRYMHLSPSALTDAIRLLERPASGSGRRDIVETAQA